MNDISPIILGYHGCDARVAEAIFAGAGSLKVSHNDYDWLADGIYFWEHNARRAYDFACSMSKRPHPSGQRIKTPAVVGAIVHLGQCLNLLDSQFIKMVQRAHHDLVHVCKAADTELPRNSGGADLVDRKLDCAVLRMLHRTRADAGESAFDTVRAAFFEGSRLYENAGFASKNHIQVCVRDHRCILGYFRPIDDRGRPIVFK